MTHIAYLIAGWGISLAAIALYAVSLVRRGKSLSVRVPAERRRWMATND